MTFKSKINHIRRRLMQSLTSSVGSSYARQQIAPIDKSKINRILISRPNHRLGNLLLMTPLVQEVAEVFPNATIDLFIKGSLGTSVFKNYSNVHLLQLPKKPFSNLMEYMKGWLHIRRTRYDIAINVMQGSSSGRLSVQFANAKYKFFGDDVANLASRYPDYQHMAKQPVYYFRHCLASIGVANIEKPVPTLNLKLSQGEISRGKEILMGLIGNKKVICLFTYATGDKCYPSSWWISFYDRLQKEYPDYAIIELIGVENISNLNFRVPTYANKDIRVVGSVIAHVNAFVGADGGTIHLAGAVNTPTLGFFSVTDEKTYQPYNGESLGLNTNHSTIDDYIKVIDRLLK